MEFARDLASADLWAESLERSLARRGRPRRASLALGRLTAERDLADGETISDSIAYWRMRRAANANSSFNVPAVGGASVLALLAATTLPSLAGGAGAPRKGSLHRTARGAGTGATPARSIIHRAVSARPSFTLGTHVAAPAAAAARRRPSPGYTLTASAPQPTTHVLTLAASAPVQAVSATTTDEHVLSSVPPDTHVLGGAASAPAAAAPITTVAAVHRVFYGKIAFGDIRDAQRMLGVAVDGILGPQTGAAIRAFQASHGLLVDGIVGRLTWDALAKAEHVALHAAHQAVFAHAVSVVREATFQPAAAS